MPYELICVGASWGGLDAVGRLLSGLPSEVDVPIVIAQHRHSAAVPSGLSELLRLRIKRPLHDAEDKMAIEHGHIYIAPPDYHLLIERGSFALSVDERVMYARPSIDVLFETASLAYGPEAIGIILTGANEDGAAGLAAVKDRGGVAIVQEPDGAARRTMPDAALAATVADAVLPVEEMGKFLYGLCVVTS